jgi:hypothetical protein
MTLQLKLTRGVETAIVANVPEAPVPRLLMAFWTILSGCSGTYIVMPPIVLIQTLTPASTSTIPRSSDNRDLIP